MLGPRLSTLGRNCGIFSRCSRTSLAARLFCAQRKPREQGTVVNARKPTEAASACEKARAAMGMAYRVRSVNEHGERRTGSAAQCRPHASSKVCMKAVPLLQQPRALLQPTPAPFSTEFVPVQRQQRLCCHLFVLVFANDAASQILLQQRTRV